MAPVNDVLLDGMLRAPGFGNGKRRTLWIPSGWKSQSLPTKANVRYYDDHIPLAPEHIQAAKRHGWVAISNARFVTRVSPQLINQLLDSTHADMVTVTARPELLAGKDRVRITTRGRLAGIRRLYFDSLEPTAMPDDWPHHVFIKNTAINKVLIDANLPISFSALMDSSLSNHLAVQAFNVGGMLLDLELEKDMLVFLTAALKRLTKNHRKSNDTYRLSPDTRIIGPVLLGKRVAIGKNTLIVGPAVICDEAKIGDGAAITTSVVAAGVDIPKGCIVQGRFVTNHTLRSERCEQQSATGPERQSISAWPRASTHRTPLYHNLNADNFRFWPRFSYAGGLKRIADIIAATGVLTLFAPFFPIIALAIKLTSKGPIFYGDTRQGLHGKPFKCLKFRTMISGANQMQNRLRFLNQADGPQFNMPDDPRLSKIGPLLRDTYLDEIPQFINVLLGQMSVVGPRPSPESENTLCPYWRDARLSVRPGITGLWQLCRTRRPMHDFQEWIYYDTQYVKNLSIKMDLSICWKTFVKIVGSFVSKF
jgi:lipopolysaccharide/colanic/teichoic acid biosynthesis glycosyltransferase